VNGFMSAVRVVVLCAVALGASPAGARAHGEPSLGTYATTGPVEVKRGPGPQYETIRTFAKGKLFEVITKEGAWLKVRLSEHQTSPAWVEARLAVRADLDRHPRGKQPIPGSYLTTTVVEARTGPGASYPIVATIPKGTRIMVVGTESEWLRIASRRGDPPRYIERKQARLEPAD
jgi:uncharacterized protein YraI